MRLFTKFVLSGTILFAQPFSLALAQSQEKSRPRTSDEAWERHLEVGLQFAGDSDLFWKLPGIFGPDPNYRTDRHWWEAYIKGGLRLTHKPSSSITIYGSVSGVASGTLRRDPYETGDTGRITLEEGMFGVRHQDSGQSLTVDASLGAQEYRVGSGMLIANGSSNGFERGALKLGPRKAWQMAGLLSAKLAPVSAEFYYLAPNELSSSESGTRLAGVVLERRNDAEHFMGVSVGRVLKSSTPYPQAAPGGVGAPIVLPGARAGLEFFYAYGRWTPFADSAPGTWIAADFARQRNSNVDLRAWGGRLEFGRAMAHLPWKPSISYSYQSFSGDDPNTPQLERFDPLYYEGNPDSWATGSKSSMVFINTNVASHQVKLGLSITARDFLTLYYAHIQADQLRSPLQFGQGTRANSTSLSAGLVAGVTAAHLSDDFFFKYTRVLGDKMYLTTGISISVPGEGIRALSSTDLPIWSGVIVNLIKQY